MSAIKSLNANVLKISYRNTTVERAKEAGIVETSVLFFFQACASAVDVITTGLSLTWLTFDLSPAGRSYLSPNIAG